MAKKRVFLIAFSAFTSFSVLAGNMSHTTAPSVEPVAAISNIDVPALQTAAQSKSSAPAPVANAPRAASAPVTQVVSAPALPSAPVEDKAVEIATAEPKLEPVVAAETVSVEHQNETDGIVAIGGQMLQSVWVDVPKILFRNASFPGAKPEPLAKSQETIPAVSPVSNTNSNANWHILTGEIARPSTNYIYRDSRLGVQLSRSLSPLDSFQTEHSASVRAAGSIIADRERILGTLPVITETAHFETSSRNSTEKLFAKDREIAITSLLPYASFETPVPSNTFAILQPLAANQNHFDSWNVAPLGLGVSVNADERKEVAELMSSLNSVSSIALQNVENDRSHNAEALQPNSNLNVSKMFERNDGTLALGNIGSVASVSGHTIFAANSTAPMPEVLSFARESNTALLASSIVPTLVKTNVDSDSSSSNRKVGFSIPVFAIADNIGAHEDRTNGYVDSVTASSREEAPSILNLNSDPKFAERSHESTFARSESLTPVYAVGTTTNDLFVQPASSNSITAHANPMDSLSRVFADNKTAALFAPEIDKSIAIIERPAVAPITNNVGVENRTASVPIRTPALIDGKIAMSHSLIAPMTSSLVAVVDDIPAFTGPVKGGPSIDLLPAASDSAPKSVGPVASATLPVLISSKTEFSSALLKPMKPAAVVSNPLGLPLTPTKGKTQQQLGYCDAGFVGDPIRFSQTVELRLEDLLSQLHSRFGINFIMGPNIGKMPINVKAGSIPWNVLLRSQLFISGIRARCIGENTIELIENSVVPTLQDGAAVSTRFLKLKFLQRTSGGTVDLANRSTGGQNGGGGGGCGGTGSSGSVAGSGTGGGGGGSGQSGETAGRQGSSRFDQLVMEIEKILGIQSRIDGSGIGGGQLVEEVRSNRSVTQIPGRNILVITASEEEHAVIKEIVDRADRPPFQVVVKGLIYTANETQLKDIGVQTTITGGTADNRVNGGIFGQSIGALGTIFDFSAIIGTFDFNVQANLFQQNGAISIKARPFATVLDGLCTRLDVGPAIPIVIDGTLGGEGSVTFVNAANNLSVTPYVVDDENGDPMAVTLEINMTANSVDNTVTTQGVPGISQRSLQTQLLLGKDKTAILGGFTVDQDRKDVIKTPGLGDIPILGHLFKRRIRDTQINRLYFAITATVLKYGEEVAPVKIPEATTEPLNTTEDMKKRGIEAEKVNKKKNVKDH